MATLFTDNFNRADENPIAGNWSTSPGAAWSMALQSDLLTSISGVNTSYGGSYVNSVSFPADQWAQVTLGSLNFTSAAGYIGCAVRMNSTGSAFNAYILGLSYYNGNHYIRVYRVLNGVGTSLTVSVQTMAIGDVWYLEAVGTTLTVKRNGSVVWTGTDSNIASGQAGAGGYAYNISYFGFTYFEAGNFSSGETDSFLLLGAE